MKPLHLILAASCLLTACKDKETHTATITPSTQAPSEALQRVLSSAPTGAPKEIHVARNGVKPGDEIALTGRIMGNEKPFVEGRAAFTLGDTTVLTACSDKPGDACETPWDNCCNTKEEKKVALATIQIVGTDNRVLKESIEGVGGLKKLGHVTISGKVAEGSTEDSLVVNAAAIQVKP